MKGSRQFLATLSEFDSMMRWIHEVLLEAPWVRKFDLVLEEALVNVIHYAYPTSSGIVQIVYEVTPTYVCFIIKDQGIAYNPLGHKQGDLEAPLEERGAGGLGVHFIKKLTDEASYQRVEDWNVLTLVQKKELGR